MVNEENIMRIKRPIQYMRHKDKKLYALIRKEYINAKSCYCYLVPWENRLNWERKNIKPEKITSIKLSKEYVLKE